MPHEVNVTGLLTLGDFGTKSFSQELDVDTLDVTAEETLVDGASDDEMEICGASAISDISFVVIKASNYGDPGDLQFKINADTETAIDLNGPLYIDGELFNTMGAAGLLPDSLFFTNGVGEDVTITVLVGRDV
jgi:hypothetical protein